MNFATIVINGYVLALYWSWFIVPIFNAKPLIFLEAAALMVLLKSFLWLRESYSDVKDKKLNFSDNVKNFMFSFCVELLVLVQLYIIKCLL